MTWHETDLTCDKNEAAFLQPMHVCMFQSKIDEQKTKDKNSDSKGTFFYSLQRNWMTGIRFIADNQWRKINGEKKTREKSMRTFHLIPRQCPWFSAFIILHWHSVVRRNFTDLSSHRLCPLSDLLFDCFIQRFQIFQCMYWCLIWKKKKKEHVYDI